MSDAESLDERPPPDIGNEAGVFLPPTGNLAPLSSAIQSITYSKSRKSVLSEYCIGKSGTEKPARR
jgi:hypothetical protein